MAKRKNKTKKINWLAYGGNPRIMPKAGLGLQKALGTVGDLNIAQMAPFPFSIADPIMDAFGSSYIVGKNKEIKTTKREAQQKLDWMQDEISTGGTKTSSQ